MASSCCCCHLAVVASSSASASAAAPGEPVRRIRRRAPGPSTQPLKPAPGPATQPSVAEVRRAIGLADDDPSASRRGERRSAFMELVASTPVGQPEGGAERRLREAAEWDVDTTEEGACQAQKSLLILCMKIFPLWLLLLSVALGIIKLPFDIPGLDNLLMDSVFVENADVKHFFEEHADANYYYLVLQPCKSYGTECYFSSYTQYSSAV